MFWLSGIVRPHNLVRAGHHRYNPHSRGVAQLVARVVRDDEVAGSSPVTPTTQSPNPLPRKG